MKTKPKTNPDARVPKLTRILVPTDFSRNAAQALRYAVPLARQVGGKITLLHVLDWPVIPATLGAVMTDEATITGTVKQALDKLAKSSVPADVLDKTLVRIGSAHRDIVEAARGLRMDLIVISTHGRTGWKRALLGNTAERVVRHALCPVLVVRQPKGARQKSPTRKPTTKAVPAAPPPR